jgi:predicted ferric reductase
MINPQWVADATGVVSLVAIVLALVAAARVKSLTRVFGIELYSVHRWLGIISVLGVVGHIVFVLLMSSSNLGKLFIWDGTLASKAADVSTYSLIALLLWRQKQNYEQWRRWHLVLASAVALAGFIHIILLAHLIKHTSFAGSITVLGCVVVIAAFYRLTSSPYSVIGVHPESPTVSTVTLAPKCGKHRPTQRRKRFQPGQFGWLRLHGQPGNDHPYSFSSSANNSQEIQVTVRKTGNFTDKLTDSVPGRTIWVDGPHGSFSPPDSAPGLVLIGAGVGMTPMMSILRTCADQQDTRSIRLIQSAESPEELLYFEEVNQLPLNLEITRVITRPRPGWVGKVGRIDIALLHQVLPGRPVRENQSFFLCGPPMMVVDTECALVSLGIPAINIHTERFNMSPTKGKPKHALEVERG